MVGKKYGISRLASPLPLAGERPGERAGVGATVGRDRNIYTHWITRLLQALLLLLLANFAHASDLTATVDRNQIGIDETLNLRLRYSGNASGGQPDFELLEQDFDILSRQQSNQYRVINGRAESFVEWALTLAPKREGKLFVPSLHYHGNVSDAIPVTVTEAGASPQSGDRQAFLEVELDKEQIHVQEQLLVKVRLYTTIGLHDIATEPLQVPGAHVEKMDEQRYERRIGGVAHAVYELTYALFPESSGELQIPPLNYVAVAGRRDPFSLFNRNSQRLRLRSQPQSIQVLPKPDSYSGAHWLPAASLGLVQTWSQDPETFKVGEPITRIITLRAEGLRAAQLPPLSKLDVEGLKTYPDQPQQDDQIGPNGITGSRIETTAIVATKPGDYQLPAITVTWWDTKSGQQRATQLPAFRFSVSGAAAAASSESQLPSAEAKPSTTPAVGDDFHFWKTLAIAALASHLLWLAYFIHLRSSARNSRASVRENAARNGRQQRVQALEQAAQDGDAAQIQHALQSWLHASGPEVREQGVLSEQPGFSEELEKLQTILNAALYAKPPKPINQQQVQILVSRLIKLGGDGRKEQRKETNPLPDLFA